MGSFTISNGGRGVREVEIIAQDQTTQLKSIPLFSTTNHLLFICYLFIYLASSFLPRPHNLPGTLTLLLSSFFLFFFKILDFGWLIRQLSG